MGGGGFGSLLDTEIDENRCYAMLAVWGISDFI